MLCTYPSSFGSMMSHPEPDLDHCLPKAHDPYVVFRSFPSGKESCGTFEPAQNDTSVLVMNCVPTTAFEVGVSPALYQLVVNIVGDTLVEGQAGYSTIKIRADDLDEYTGQLDCVSLPLKPIAPTWHSSWVYLRLPKNPKSGYACTIRKAVYHGEAVPFRPPKISSELVSDLDDVFFSKSEYAYHLTQGLWFHLFHFKRLSVKKDETKNTYAQARQFKVMWGLPPSLSYTAEGKKLYEEQSQILLDKHLEEYECLSEDEKNRRLYEARQRERDRTFRAQHRDDLAKKNDAAGPSTRQYTQYTF